MYWPFDDAFAHHLGALKVAMASLLCVVTVMSFVVCSSWTSQPHLLAMRRMTVGPAFARQRPREALYKVWQRREAPSMQCSTLGRRDEPKAIELSASNP